MIRGVTGVVLASWDQLSPNTVKIAYLHCEVVLGASKA